MDDSKPRKSDAAATRKRRSSILKSQRSVRAPLSELEFNVATPPDQAKSRRVSFSRRTGVAEFEINEATTAWKNVYEEHNKSLESSANESGMKAAPRRVAHLGGRAAHFTDDEADVIDTREPEPPPGAELSQLAHTHNTIQLFRLDANPGLRELTDNLHVDFSAVVPLGDDLDVLRQDLERETRPANISEYSIDVDFNATHFTLKGDDDDMSITDTIRSPTVTSAETRSRVDWAADKENIVVNPYVAPKASENFAVSDDGEDILVFDGKKCKFQSNLDLSDDEFKSKTVVYDDAASDMSVTQAVARVVLPARDEVVPPGRVEKTVFLDNDMTVTGVVPAQIFACKINDDKPSKTVVYDDAAADMSVTQAVSRVVLPARDEVISSAREKTVLFDNDMTVTGVVPAQIFQTEVSDDKASKTVVYDDAAADMSVTQAVARFLQPERDDVIPRSCVGHKTVLLDDDMAMTRAVPAEIFQSENIIYHHDSKPSRTVVYDDTAGDMSVTQAVERVLLPQDDVARCGIGQKTVLNDSMAMTLALPAEILLSEDRNESVAECNATQRKTFVFGNDDGNISVTQAVPTNIINAEKSALDDAVEMPLGPPEEIVLSEDRHEEVAEPNATRRKTVVFSDDDGNISVTQAVPANIINAEKTVLDDALAMTRTLPAEIHSSEDRYEEVTEPNATRRKTVVFGNDDGNISMTQAVCANIINAEKTARDDSLAMTPVLPAEIRSSEDTHEGVLEPNATRRKTLVFGDDDGNISVTQAVPTSIINAKNTVLDDAIAMTRAPRAESLMSEDRHEGTVELNASQRKTVVIGNDDGNISVTQAIPANIINSQEMKPEPKERTNISADSILDVLLDMSQASKEELAIEYVPKATASNMTVTEALHASNTTLTNGGPLSESYMIVCGDNEAVNDEDNVSKLANHSEYNPERPAIEGSLLPIEYKKEHGIVCKLQHKLGALKELIHFKEKTSPKKSPKSITYSNTTEADKNLSVNTSIAPPKSPLGLENRSQINTHLKSESSEHEIVKQEQNETLTVNLSSGASLHDGESSPMSLKKESLTSSHDCEEENAEPAEKEQSQWTGQADDTRAILDAISDFTETRRSGGFEQKPAGANKSRRSSAADRKSMVISRDDMLREISMAQAIMKTEMQQTEAETTEISSDEHETPPRLSGEVVKTLRFEDDESIIEPRVLHKPAAVRSPPRRASTVIPTYDVSEHVKELVHDLIKPMADESQCLPKFLRDPERGIQIDTLESSQIDLIPSTPVLLEPRRTPRVRSPEPQHSDIDMSPPRQVVIEPRRRSCLRSPEPVPYESKTPSPRKPTTEPAVIVFDHLNPLNNVLLPLVDQSAVHKYNPRHSNQSISPSLDSQAVQTDTSEPKSRGVDCGMALVTSMVDRGVASERSMRDTEANTSIVMKGNRELLAASSSLTLVDDALARSGFDVPVPERRRSQVRVLFRLDDASSVKLDSELTSSNASDRSHKRGHIAGKGLEVTPKPAIKVQRVSTGSKLVRRRRSLSPSPSPTRSEGGRSSTAAAAAAAAAEALTSASTVGALPSSSDSVSTVAALPSSSGSVSTVAALPSSSGSVSTVAALPSSSGSVSTVAALWACARSVGVGAGAGAAAGAERADWRPELLHEPSSKNLASEQDPGVNVVAKIDVLPFMGTSECEWESRAADTWSFRLLRSRLRLLVKLEHRACNTTRATVRADTPVRLVLVQHARRESDDDPVASLCLCLAAAALQRLAARGVTRAGAVPGLLRRCAAVARVALRWGRAMRAARAGLAFDLKEDGSLSLKVANIPLRSVWEVTLRVELADAGRGAPWPRAAGASVARVVAAWAPPPHELQRLLETVPEDWGHVPRTVWKIFKYLKNKRPEDDLLTA